tara:strand:+ start:144 stop:716 length:573 start_codon:yes stop_codon:yes gene_type:complete
MNKVLYCIRHGIATHNKLFPLIGNKAYREYRDTRLICDGLNQAKQLRQTWKEKDDVELIIASPSRRTLETAVLIFHNKPIVALDCLLEYPIGGTDICNRRMDRSELGILYPYVYLSQIPTNELEWKGENESIEQLNARIQTMKNWIFARPEKTIAIVGHSWFLEQFMVGKMGDENNELKHCFPYKINATF